MTIKKQGSQYVLKSKTHPGKTLGHFNTKAEAIKREKQIIYFKNKVGEKKKGK